LLSRGDIFQLDHFFFNLAMQEMVFNIDVFHAIVELGVFYDGHSGLAVHADYGHVVVCKSDFREELPEPNDLFGGVSTSDVLGFSTRLCD
jgi:hypothetical protein